VIEHLRLWWRGFCIVALTATNVVQVTEGHWLGAFVVSFAISFVWWGNANRAAHHPARFGREVYALGAACGTVVGLVVTRWWYDS
jgi:hypothetical protein